MKSTIKLELSLFLAAATVAGCKSTGSGYKVPPGGSATNDPSGLQITATNVSTSAKGFTVTFEFANQSDTGLLVPFTEIEASWGEQVAKVEVDTRKVRRDMPVAVLRLPGAIDRGLFEGTSWVTGSDGEPPRGDAIFVKAKSRVQKFVVTCSVPRQQGAPLVVRWPHVYSGDAQGAISATVATGVTWTMAPPSAP